jgi:hypothetical protein
VEANSIIDDLKTAVPPKVEVKDESDQTEEFIKETVETTSHSVQTEMITFQNVEIQTEAEIPQEESTKVEEIDPLPSTTTVEEVLKIKITVDQSSQTEPLILVSPPPEILAPKDMETSSVLTDANDEEGSGSVGTNSASEFSIQSSEVSVPTSTPIPRKESKEDIKGRLSSSFDERTDPVEKKRQSVGSGVSLDALLRADRIKEQLGNQYKGWNSLRFGTYKNFLINFRKRTSSSIHCYFQKYHKPRLYRLFSSSQKTK